MRILKGLGRDTRALLDSRESQTLEFKEKLKGLTQEDLVAFANAEGGVILIGVSDEQPARLVGCQFDDRDELQIRQIAGSIIPPLAIRLRVENTRSSVLVHIAIKASEARPHCTSGGKYVIRDGNKNRALMPSEMLELFLETQSRQFFERFEKAAIKVLARLDSMHLDVGRMADQVTRGISDVFDESRGAYETSDQALARVDETDANIDALHRTMGEMHGEQSDIRLMLLQLIDHFDLDRPEVLVAAKTARVAAMFTIAAEGEDKPDVELLRAGLLGDPKLQVIRERLGEEKFKRVVLQAFTLFRKMDPVERSRWIGQRRTLKESQPARNQSPGRSGRRR